MLPQIRSTHQRNRKQNIRYLNHSSIDHDTSVFNSMTVKSSTRNYTNESIDNLPDRMGSLDFATNVT